MGRSGANATMSGWLLTEGFSFRYGISSDIGFWREEYLSADLDEFSSVQDWLKEKALRQKDVDALVQFMESSQDTMSNVFQRLGDALAQLAQPYGSALQFKHFHGSAIAWYRRGLDSLKNPLVELPQRSPLSDFEWEGPLLTIDCGQCFLGSSTSG